MRGLAKDVFETNFAGPFDIFKFDITWDCICFVVVGRSDVVDVENLAS
jgi:hypothetical protein